MNTSLSHPQNTSTEREIGSQYPMTEWNRLLLHAVMSLNLLSSFSLHPSMSAHASLFGNHDFIGVPWYHQVKGFCSHIDQQSSITFPSWLSGQVYWPVSGTLSVTGFTSPTLWSNAIYQKWFFQKKTISICITHYLHQADCSRFTPPQAPQQKTVVSSIFWSTKSQSIHQIGNNTRACLWTTPISHPTNSSRQQLQGC